MRSLALSMLDALVAGGCMGDGLLHVFASGVAGVVVFAATLTVGGIRAARRGRGAALASALLLFPLAVLAGFTAGGASLFLSAELDWGLAVPWVVGGVPVLGALAWIATDARRQLRATVRAARRL